MNCLSRETNLNEQFEDYVNQAPEIGTETVKLKTYQ
jgi:hypothetical protein